MTLFIIGLIVGLFLGVLLMCLLSMAEAPPSIIDDSERWCQISKEMGYGDKD